MHCVPLSQFPNALSSPFAAPFLEPAGGARELVAEHQLDAWVWVGAGVELVAPDAERGEPFACGAVARTAVQPPDEEVVSTCRVDSALERTSSTI